MNMSENGNINENCNEIKNEKLMAFLDELGRYLNDLPEAEKDKVLNYYEEYLHDAQEEGVSPEDLLSRLEDPADIAASIKAESSIRYMRNKPGLKNYARVVKYARIGIKRPLTIFLFSLLIFMTYSIAVSLFIVTVASAASACVILPVFVAEAIKIPSQYIGDAIGTISMGIFFAGIMILIAWGFFKLSGLLFRLSAGLIARMLNKNTRPASDGAKSTVAIDGNIGENKGRPGNTSALVFKISLSIIAAGLVFALATGLPTKLFVLFNSMKPSNITLQQWEYSTDSADNISINTAHSNIIMVAGNSDKIKIQYEQSDWLEPEISSIDGQLTFTEKSNGRMLLFSLVTMHENRAELTVSIPEGYKAGNVELESRGGFIYITDTKVPVQAKTYTGSIYVEQKDDSGPAALKAGTSAGIIKAYGKNAGTKNNGRTVYQSDSQNGALIQLESDRGSIFIE